MTYYGVVTGKRSIAETFSRLREQGKVRAFDLALRFVATPAEQFAQLCIS
jgi:hypothetical protein